MAQTVKNLPAVQYTWIRSLGGEDSLEKGWATHSTTLPGEFHEQRSLVGYRLCGWKESDTAEWRTLSLIQPHKMSWEMFLLLLFSWRDFISSLQFSSVTRSCWTLCDPMNRSTPGLPVHHQLPEFTQTHVHRDSDAIKPSHPLSSLSSPALNLSQH